jgi:hypothetical protein
MMKQAFVSRMNNMLAIVCAVYRPHPNRVDLEVAPI